MRPALAALLFLAAAPSLAAPARIDVRGGTPFRAGVRGLALADLAITRPSSRVAIPGTLAVCDGSALRGVAGGLYADLYDWRTRNNEPRPPTLELLRQARDHHATLFLTVNTRGVVEPDPANPGKTRYSDTSVETLARMAADWVRYVNHIVPSYRQGDPVADARDAAILASLRWSSGVPGDRFDTLTAPGEALPPKVTFWEIGNEPTVSVAKGIGVSNGITLSAAEYHDRYVAITRAMRAEDPTIRVGPCLLNATRNREHLMALLRDPAAPVDFISYHPYQKLGLRTEPPKVTSYLARNVAAGQERTAAALRAAVREAGRDPERVELVASEWFVSDWPYNDRPAEGQMAHALGTVESIFTFARLHLLAAHYWIWAANADDGTAYPVTMAFRMLRDHMGDTLLATVRGRTHRLYATRDSRTGAIALWGLNFASEGDVTLDLSLPGLHGRKATLHTLGARSGPTRLDSANLSARQPGGPRDDVAWRSVRVRSLNTVRFHLTLPAATVCVLTLE